MSPYRRFGWIVVLCVSVSLATGLALAKSGAANRAAAKGKTTRAMESPGRAGPAEKVPIDGAASTAAWVRPDAGSTIASTPPGERVVLVGPRKPARPTRPAESGVEATASLSESADSLADAPETPLAGGDTCATAPTFTDLDLPYTDTGILGNFIDDYKGECTSGTGGLDAVYRFLPSDDIRINVSLCDSEEYDTVLYIYEDDCDTEVPADCKTDSGCDDNGCFGSSKSELLSVPLLGGNEYYIVVDGHDTNDTDGYTLDVSEDFPKPGDNCDYPIVIYTLPFQDFGQTTDCMHYDYQDTCLGNYDLGEDIIYELHIADAGCFDITLDPGFTGYTGMAIDDNCPPDLDCIATSTRSSSDSHGFDGLFLSAGTYYIMIDTWSLYDIFAFDLTIVEVDCPGACCYPYPDYNVCQDAVSQEYCEVTLDGIYQEDETDCDMPQACCRLSNGHCETVSQLCCDETSDYCTCQGPGTACTTDEGCCLPDGSCVMADPLCCVNELSGVPQGPGTACTVDEACCLPDGSCLMIDPLCCDDPPYNGAPQGAASVCLGVQACCLENWECVDVDALCCETELGGEPQGEGTVCTAWHLYAGTQGGGAGGGGKVYRHHGGTTTTWTDLTPPGTWTASAVMDMAYYAESVYAAVQTAPGYGGGAGQGQVWRHNSQTDWTQVGTLDNSVMVLDVYEGDLYAATNGNVLYRYDGPHSWSDVSTARYDTGFRAGHVSSVCGEPQLFLGELNSDAFWRYTVAGGLEFLEDHSGSCIWDFADFSGRLYAGAYAGSGPIFRTVDELECGSPPLFEQIHTTGLNNWALEPFDGKLYVGGGGNPGDEGAELWAYDGDSWNLANTWPTTIMNEGVSALAAQGDEYLYIGLGLPDGYYYIGDGRAEVWWFDGGAEYARVSEDDYFGGGVQSLLLVPEKICDPKQACCVSDGSCAMRDPGVCHIQDSDPMGEGTECDDDDGDGIADVCELHLIILLDRTGSMNRIRPKPPSTGNSRCVDALEEAKRNLAGFYQKHERARGDDVAAVWTFAGNGPTPRTNGFVSLDDAMAALVALEDEPCRGMTPLAESMCDAADYIHNEFLGLPGQSLFMDVATDGEENHSDGECYGRPSQPPPADPPPCRYDDRSWHQKVCQKCIETYGLTLVIKYFGDEDAKTGGYDSETGEPRTMALTDAAYFEALALGSGPKGAYVYIDDADPNFPPQAGVCCSPDCVAPVTQTDCEDSGGEYVGDGTFCLGDNNGNGMDDACEAVCGDNIREGYEECDGTDDDACPGECIGPGLPNECTCAPGLGACCFEDGTCYDFQTETGCQGAGGEYLGDDTVCAGSDGDGIDNACCTVVCDPGATFENEVDCLTGYDDQANGGCLAHPGSPVFGSILCGETVCGTTGIYEHLIHCTEDSDCPDDGCNEVNGECNTLTENTRDRDVYQIDTTAAGKWKTMRFSVESEAVRTLAGLVEQDPPGSDDCGDSTGYISPAMLPSWCDRDWVEVTAPPGTYWWYVAAATDSGSVCGSGSTYNATLTCEDFVCDGDTCDDAYKIDMLPFVRTRPSCDCTDDYDEECPAPSALTSPDAVYKYTPPSNTIVNISLCESGYDTKLYVYENTCPAPGTGPTGTEYACADDTPGCGGGARSRISNLPLTGGHTYVSVLRTPFE